ncbi:MAG: nuclear transport factor 2 family protein [Actinomycetales bacterium]
MWAALTDATRVPPLPPGDLEALTAAVTQLRHRQAIADLALLYTRAVDDCDLDAVVEMFTPDGVFERRGVAAKGAEQVREAYRVAMATYRTTLHTLDAHVVELTGPDTAVGWAGGHAELVTGRTTVLAAYRYDDEYALVDSRWKFARRSITFMYAVPADEVASALSGPLRMRWPRTEAGPADYPEGLPTWPIERE